MTTVSSHVSSMKILVLLAAAVDEDDIMTWLLCSIDVLLLYPRPHQSVERIE
jgi:hypothetical protein